MDSQRHEHAVGSTLNPIQHNWRYNKVGKYIYQVPGMTLSLDTELTFLNTRRLLHTFHGKSASHGTCCGNLGASLGILIYHENFGHSKGYSLLYPMEYAMGILVVHWEHGLGICPRELGLSSGTSLQGNLTGAHRISHGRKFSRLGQIVSTHRQTDR